MSAGRPEPSLPRASCSDRTASLHLIVDRLQDLTAQLPTLGHVAGFSLIAIIYSACFTCFDVHVPDPISTILSYTTILT